MMSKSFSKAFTLIELLTTLAVLVIALFFLSPVIFQLNDRLTLNSEVENLKAFVYQINTQARLRKQNFTLVLSENLLQSKWCIAAIQSDGKAGTKFICDCLNSTDCAKYKNVYFYYSHDFKTHPITKKSYPNSLTDIDGISGKNSEYCLKLEKNLLTRIIQVNKIGGINLDPKRSSC